ncbi:MAG: tetratricopeptide repeat protein, partial [Dysgonamonadaceae bacterium]|nr:tetratricopeptide repeat protein [Dysgonamonadaceae bacterium]
MKRTVLVFLSVAMVAFCSIAKSQDVMDSTIDHCWKLFEEGNQIEAIVDLEIFLKELEPNSLDYGIVCCYLGMMNCDREHPDYFEAKDYYLKAYEIHEKQLGKSHPDCEYLLSFLGGICYKTSDYVRAEKFYLEYKNVIEKSKGKDNTDYALVLSNIGVTYYQLKQYDLSENYLLEAKNIRETVMGKENSIYVSTLNNLGDVYKTKLNYSLSEKYYIEAKNIIEKMYGKKHDDYTKSLRNLASLFHEKGEYGKSDKYYSEISNIAKDILNDDINMAELSKIEHDENSLNTIVDLAKKFIDEKEYQEAIDILEPALQNNYYDKDTSRFYALCYLALAYNANGEYDLSEMLLTDELNVYKKQNKEEEYESRLLLSILSAIYQKRNIISEKAIKIITDYLVIIGDEESKYGTMLEYLGDIYQQKGNFAEAEKYYLEAKDYYATVENLFYTSKTHRVYTEILGKIGNFYNSNGEKTKAKAFYNEAAEILIDKLKWDRNKEGLLVELGNIYKNSGELSKSKSYYLKSKEIEKGALNLEELNFLLYDINKKMGLLSEAKQYLDSLIISTSDLLPRIDITGAEKPITYIDALNEMFLFLLSFNEYDDAYNYYNLILKYNKDHISVRFTKQSEIQRSSFWNQNVLDFEEFYSLIHHKPSSRTKETAYNNVLFMKGLLLRSARNILALINSISTYDSIRFDSYAEYNDIVYKVHSGLAHSIRRGYKIFNDKNIDDDKLEILLYNISTSINEKLKNDFSYEWQDVQKQLKPGDAALEFVHFRLYDKNWTDTTLYAAMVLRPGMKSPAWIPLCEQKQLQAVLHTDTRDTREQTETLYSGKGGQLYQLVWQALEKELPNVKNIYYSPSGLLHKIAFNALPTDKDGLLLSDKYKLHLVSSTREVVRLKKETSAFTQDTATVYGGLHYDASQTAMVAAAKRYQQSAGNDRFMDRLRKRDAELPDMESRSGFSEWNYLAGTKTETERIV